MIKLPNFCEEQPLLCYWEENKADIANHRHWMCKDDSCPNNCLSNCAKKHENCLSSCKESCWRNCPASLLDRRTESCVTLHNYSRFAERLNGYLPMNLTQVTPRDVAAALAAIQEEGHWGGEYEDATMESYRTFLRILFRYAREQGAAYDIMHFEEALNTAVQSFGYQLDRYLTKEEEKAVLKKLYHKTREKPRSLTIWQQEKLLKRICKGLRKDGRYLGVAIILYAGLRPAECRGLLWKDIVPFLDHPDRHLINVYKSRNDEGNLQYRLKTHNGYRRIPIHCELEGLIAERLAFMKEQVSEEDFGNLPICCIGNHFSLPCKEHHLSTFAEELFDGLQLSMDDLLPYYIDVQLDDEEETLPQHLTLYVLRRNFWTWLASSTQLSDMDKRYIMGHDMVVNRKDLRKHYNNENRLWDMAQHMDRCILSKDLHEPFLLHILAPDTPIIFSNQGIVRIQVPKELLADGAKLHLRLSTEATGEAIQMKVLSKPQGNFSLSSSVDDLEPKPKTLRINCQYENWLAHQDPTPPADKSDPPEQEDVAHNTSQEPSCEAESPDEGDAPIEDTAS